MTQDRTPAQLYSLVFGITLLAAGILGFIAESSFSTGDDLEGSKLIVFEVNGWHNLVHIASGALGLALAGSAAGARKFALGFGVVYLAVTIWGFADGESILEILPINTADNLLHVAISLTGIAAGLASSSTTDRPRTATV